MDFLIILNEHAGSGNSVSVWDKIEPELKRRNINYQVKISQYPGHTTFLARQYVQNSVNPNNEVLLIIGGDGTLHQALNGAMSAGVEYKIPLAYIPAGSGNDFARALKMSTKPIAALEEVLACNEPTEICIGEYDEKIKDEHGYFVNNIGVGFDASVVSATNSSTSKKALNKYHMGSLAYISSILGVVYHQQTFPLTVHVGEQKDLFQQAFLVTTSNHPFFGGGVKILPKASVHDADLELIVFEKKNFFILLWFTLLLLMGRHLKSKFVRHYKAENIHLTTNSLEYGQIDGEVMGDRFFDLNMQVKKYPFWINVNNK